MNAGSTLTWNTFQDERGRRGLPFVVAHRGVPVHEPENTLSSFALALQQGADALETDLRFTRDDQIVLFHDATLERTTDGQGPVRDHTLLELRRFRTRTPAGQFCDQHIPSLIELLAMTQGRTPLLLELKDRRFARQHYAKQLIEILVAYDALERCAIISFKPELVRSINQVHSGIPTGDITLWNPAPSRGVRLMGPYWPLLYVNPLYVAWAHRMDAIVAPLDPDPTPRLNYYLNLGVDALLADNPAEVIIELEKR
jgi:glycerophosphoryl diester phosphodiesterase